MEENTIIDLLEELILTTHGINILATALKHFDLDQIYLRPVLRELLDKIPKQRPLNLIDMEKLKDSP